MTSNCNKIKGVMAAVVSVACSFVSAQSYNITPSNTIIAAAPFALPTHFNIQQNNLTSGNLIFSWELISLNIPIGWSANLCDNGHCYTGFPSNGTMDTVFNGDYGLMSVGINPDTISGTALIKYAVWDTNFPTLKDTLTWIISANGFTGINNYDSRLSYIIYPNPANENINIVSNQKAGYHFLINDISGKKILQGNFISNTFSTSTKNIPDGIYSISIFDKNKNFSTQKIIIHH